MTVGTRSSATTPIFACVGVFASALFGTLICKVVSGSFVPPAAFGKAMVFGSLDALFAIGLLLVYRASRVVNFAQGSLGVMGATLFTMLTIYQELPFFVTFPAAIAASAFTGAAVEVLLVRRLSRSPRLALTVVTIGVSQVLLAAAGFLTLFFIDPFDPAPTGGISTPFSSFQWVWSPLVFTGDHVLVVVVALGAMAGLAAFFRFSSVGIAIRGSAENSDRAEMLGVDVSNLSTLVWVLAAVLSGLAATLAIPLDSGLAGGLGGGSIGAGAAGATLLLRGLAAAVVGRMESVPITVAAALGIAAFDEAMFWSFDNTALTNAALFGLLIVVLLVQRSRVGRADEGQTSSWAASEEIRGIPVELRDRLPVRLGVRRARTVLVAVGLAYPWIMSPSQVSDGSRYMIYGIVVISLVVLTGWGGQISLGQFGFVAVGGVLGGYMTQEMGVPFLLALPIAGVVGGGAAVAIGLPAMRIRGLFLAVTTLGFAVAVSTVFLNPRFFDWLIPTEIARPKIVFLDAADERVFFYLTVVALLFAYWVARGLRQSRAGRVLIAMRDNERTAQAFGINRVRTRLATFAVSGFLASFAGALLAHQQLSINARSYGPEQSVQIFLIAVIGGLGSIGGSLIGVAYMAAVTILFASPSIQLLLSGVGVIVVLLFYPAGLGGLFFAVRDAWLRRIAMRARINVPSLLGDRTGRPGDLDRAPLAKDGTGPGAEKIPAKYRIESSIGVRGESQQAHGWRYN